MRVTRQYERPPLVEAIFEVHVEPTRTTGDISEITSLMPEFSGKLELLQDVGIEVLVGPGPALRPTAHSTSRVRRWDAAGRRAIQVGPTMCTLNILQAGYGHFEDHLPRLDGLVGSFLDRTQPKSITSVGQRYLNVLEIPLAHPAVADYVTLYPAFAGREPAHRPLAVQVEVARTTDVAVLVGFAFQGIEATTARYVLDVYARSAGPVECTAAAVGRWQRAAHDLVSDSFEAAITDQARTELFKERS